MRPRLVIIGNGMVATRVIEQLTLDAPTLFDIHVFGAERGGSYNRILLSSWLAGDVDEQEVVTHSLSWYAERNVRLHAHTRVVSLDLRNKQVIADDDSALTYDHLLLATGSYPATPSVAGMALRGISSFRTRDDVAQLLRDAGEPTVVVGGGVLGLEAAYGLAMRGAQVTVVHPHAHVMEKQLDAEAGRIVQRQLEERGIRFVCNARCTAFHGQDSVDRVQLSNGEELTTCRVVIAAGITPAAELARSAGIHCGRGITVNDQLRSSDPHVSALGECAEHRGQCHGLLAPLWEQVDVWLQVMQGNAAARCATPVLHTRLKVPCVPVFAAGEFHADGNVENLHYRDASHGIYKHLQLTAGALTGVRLCGDLDDAPWYLDLLQQRASIPLQRSHLLFGQHAG